MQNPTNNRERGFTLIELVIVMAVMLIVITSISSVFISQRKAFDVQEQIIEMIQNGRAAMDMMSGEIRMTGYGVPKADLSTWISWVSDITMDTNPKIVQGSESAPDEIHMAGCFDGPVTTLSATAEPGDTSLSVTHGSVFNTSTKKVISINGLENAVIRSISGGTLIIDTDPAMTGNQGLNNDYESGTGIYIIKVISYSIVDNTLKRNENTGGGRQPMAENMVDLQITRTGDTVEIDPLTAQADKPDPDYSQNGGYRRHELRTFITPPNLLMK